jgi:hypothetical protein
LNKSGIKKYRYTIIGFIFFLFLFGLWSVRAIPQDIQYHNFGDNRKIFGIPNFWDVASNLPILYIGCLGLLASSKNMKLRPDFVSKWIPIVFCLGVVSTFLGHPTTIWPQKMTP